MMNNFSGVFSVTFGHPFFIYKKANSFAYNYKKLGILY